MTRVAAIDVGTNSVKLAIANVAGDVDVEHEEGLITRLGQGVDEAGALREDAMERTLLVVEQFAQIARSSGAEQVVVIGTSALRDARNGADFMANVLRRTGLELEIISGEREAHLAYRAVSSDPLFQSNAISSLIVFDIGGGSTEVNFGRGDIVDFHRSLDIGAVRLTERLLHSDPPQPGEIRAAMDQVSTIFDELQTPSIALSGVGIGGTVVNAASVIAGERSHIHGQILERAQVIELIQRLASVPLPIRKTIPGLEPARADVIVAGVVILAGLMTKLNLQQVGVSTRGLRYGLLTEIADSLPVKTG